jgi:solute carrier family 45 protein 1/2/4
MTLGYPCRCTSRFRKANANNQPYLSSLGVPDTQLPIYMLSGPLAGLVGPPVIVALSDSCQSRWGRRKPFIFFGGLGTIMSFLVFATAQPLGLALANSIPNPGGHDTAMIASQIIAGISIYALSFSIQPLQLGLRASVVDHFGPNQQPTAHLWISRFSALGSVFIALFGVCYSAVFWDLTLVVTAILSLVLFVVMLTNTAETVPAWSEIEKNAEPTSVYNHLSRLMGTAKNLPPVTQRTCRVQLVSWFAWFLVLHYTSA